MTMKAGDLSYNLKRFFTHAVEERETYKHIGDIEQIQVFKKNDIYLLKKEDIGVAFFEVKTYNSSETKPYNDATLINVAYIDDDFRGKNILEKFIWFLKRHEHASKILLGDIHSAMMVNAVKKLSKRFETSWVKKNEKIKFDPIKADDFYGVGHTTGRQIMFENQGDFESWPRFFNEDSPDIKQYYYWLLE
jgi:hypothetical protein